MKLKSAIKILKNVIRERNKPDNGLPQDLGDIIKIYEAIKYAIKVLEKQD